jgi:hypothetical protein
MMASSVFSMDKADQTNGVADDIVCIKFKLGFPVRIADRLDEIEHNIIALVCHSRNDRVASVEFSLSPINVRQQSGL